MNKKLMQVTYVTLIHCKQKKMTNQMMTYVLTPLLEKLITPQTTHPLLQEEQIDKRKIQ